MRFDLIDQIVELVPGQRIKAVKNLTLGEEYLADHFPTFPVMPGVLMLEALVQAAAWLLRATEDFKHSVITLREVRGVKYGSFVEPGRQLQITAEFADKKPQTDKLIAFKGNGEVEGTATVTARFVVTRYNLGDTNPALADLDAKLVSYYRDQFAVLRQEAGKASG